MHANLGACDPVEWLCIVCVFVACVHLCIVWVYVACSCFCVCGVLDCLDMSFFRVGIQIKLENWHYESYFSQVLSIDHKLAWSAEVQHRSMVSVCPRIDLLIRFFRRFWKNYVAQHVSFKKMFSWISKLTVRGKQKIYITDYDQCLYWKSNQCFWLLETNSNPSNICSPRTGSKWSSSS